MVNIASYIKKSVREYHDKVAIRMNQKEYTYDEFDQKASSLAQYFLSKGIGKGSKVGIFMMNNPDYVITMYATWMIGGIVIPINYRFREEELEFVIQDSKVNLLVISASDAVRLGSVFRKFDDLLLVNQGEGASSEILENIYENKVSKMKIQSCLDSDDALLMYTSGTTGRPKGVRQTHRTNTASIEMVIDAWQVTSKDHLLGTLPMFHVGGLQCSILPALFAGGTITLLPRWNVEEWISLTKNYKPTWTGMVSTMLADSVNYAKSHSIVQKEFDSYRFCVFGGSPTPSVICDYFEKSFISPLYELYGQTELSGLMITYSFGDKRRAGSMGQIRNQVVEAKVVSHDGKRLILPGENESGELFLRGDIVTPGYWQRDDLNTERFVDGWLRTGDIVSWDKDKYLYYADRFDDMIITGGENVYPKEVENILASHHGVAEVAVIGTPHNRWIEQVTAIIVPRDSTILKEEIIAFVEEHTGLADYKKPKRIEFVQELPRTGSGKLGKHSLKQQYSDEALGVGEK